MIVITIFMFGIFITACVAMFVRSEYAKMAANPELYQKSAKDYFVADRIEDTKGKLAE